MAGQEKILLAARPLTRTQGKKPAPGDPPPLSEDVAKLRAALVGTCGNVTKAAIKLECTKPWLMNLLRRHDLNEYARDLRQKSGQPWTGRPYGAQIRAN